MRFSTTCPRCDTRPVVSTPLAGPKASFYCPDCDVSLTTGDWK